MDINTPRARCTAGPNKGAEGRLIQTGRCMGDLVTDGGERLPVFLDEITPVLVIS